MKKILIYCFLISIVLNLSGCNISDLSYSNKSEIDKVSSEYQNINVHIDESCLTYNEITFDQKYVDSFCSEMEFLHNDFVNDLYDIPDFVEEETIEGIEITNINFEEDEVLYDAIYKDNVIINIYLPSEIDGKPVLSIANINHYNMETYFINLFLPESTLMLKNVIFDPGLIRVNDNLKYVGCTETIDRITNNMKCFSGAAFLNQETLDINDSIIYKKPRINGIIETVNFNSFNEYGHVPLIGYENARGFEILDNVYISSDIKTVNINCNMPAGFANDLVVTSDVLNIKDDISIGFVDYCSVDKDYYYENENGGILNIGKNVRISTDEHGEDGGINSHAHMFIYNIKQYIINDISNADLFIEELYRPILVKGCKIVNKTGQDINWSEMFDLNSECNFQTGTLDCVDYTVEVCDK